MTDTIVCYRCGASLASLTLPLSRRDLCPACSVHVHVCRMCQFYDADATGECLEDDAEEVLEKERVNYCEWFKPRTDAYDPERGGAEARAQAELASLFGDAPAGDGTGADATTDDATSAAEDLFK